MASELRRTDVETTLLRRINVDTSLQRHVPAGLYRDKRYLLPWLAYFWKVCFRFLIVYQQPLAGGAICWQGIGNPHERVLAAT